MIYVADTRTIRAVTDTGVVTTIAGDAGQSGSADGTGSAARFGIVRGICIAPNGDLFVTDLGPTGGGGTIRKVTQAGVVTTIAGSPTLSGSADGTGTAARFSSPYGITINSMGDLYICDESGMTIRKVTQGGVVTTLCGQPGVIGGQNGTGSAALFSAPCQICTNSSGDMFVCERTVYQPHNYTIRKVTTAGVVTTFAGSFGQSGTVNGTGSEARFSDPRAICAAPNGDLFVMDGGLIRKITPGAVVSTVGGTQGEFVQANGITANATGKIYISDTLNYVLREQQT